MNIGDAYAGFPEWEAVTSCVALRVHMQLAVLVNPKPTDGSLDTY